MNINESAAMQYIYENYTLSGEAQRMCASLLNYVRNHDLPDPVGLILDVLDGIGFDMSDWNQLVLLGIVQ